MLNDPNTVFPPPTIGMRLELLIRDLHTYANYEQLAENATNAGAVMKESADFYAGRILNTLKSLLNGKTEEEVRMLFTDWQWILDI